MADTQSPQTGEQVTETVDTLRNLSAQFQAWLDVGPDKQPVWRDTGTRPFGTGDLKHFVMTLGDAVVRLTTAARQPKS